MKPIYVFYHAYSGGRTEGLDIIMGQLEDLKRSGLAQSAHEIHIGCEKSRGLDIAMAAPDNATIHEFPEPVVSELPTMRLILNGLREGRYVCYFHSKGTSRRNDPYRGWRRDMMRACIAHWRECVSALDRGHDVAGTRWIEPRRGNTYPPGQRYFAGNFWWSTSEYLLGLAPLVEPQFAGRSEFKNRYEAECWIGKSKRTPKVARI
jgi:hypothetical protein